MKNLILILTLAISFFASCFVYGQLTEKPLGSTKSAAGYIEYLPASYKSNPTKRLPIILFFHGSGEGGNGTTDLSKIYNTGLPAMIKNGSWTYKDQFVVLMPQHNSTSTCFAASEIKNFIDFARRTYRVDTSQVFLTGLSCGANGIWRYIGAYPSNDIVAAAAPISGNSLSAYTAAGCTITIPLWAFHGGSDQTSPTKNDIAGHDSINNCPTPHPEASLTVYPGVGHNCWDMTYDLSAGHDIYAWFLKHRSPSANINQAPTDIQLSNLQVKENQPIGTVVGIFTSTDPDAGNTFTYTLEIGGTNNDIASFSINNNQLKTKAVFNYATKSNYRIKVRTTDQGGLYKEKWYDSIKVIPNVTTGFEPNREKSHVAIFPNPIVNNTLHIYLDAKAVCTIEIFTMQGCKVYEERSTIETQINTSTWEEGTYIVRVTGENRIEHKKITILK